MPPDNLVDSTQLLLLPAHTGGAIAFILGFIVFEAYTLLFGTNISFAPREQLARWVCAFGAGIGGVLFMAGLVAKTYTFGLCCADVYKPVDMEAVRRARSHGLHSIAHFDLELISRATLHPDAPLPDFQGLYDTATGWGLVFKLISFWGEFIAGFFVLLGHLFIWYFCPDRHVHLQNRVDTV